MDWKSSGYAAIQIAKQMSHLVPLYGINFYLVPLYVPLSCSIVSTFIFFHCTYLYPAPKEAECAAKGPPPPLNNPTAARFLFFLEISISY